MRTSTYGYASNRTTRGVDPSGRVGIVGVIIIGGVVVIVVEVCLLSWWNRNRCAALAEEVEGNLPSMNNCAWPQTSADECVCNDLHWHCVTHCRITAIYNARLSNFCGMTEDTDERKARGPGQACANAGAFSLQECNDCCKQTYTEVDCDIPQRPCPGRCPPGTVGAS